MTHSKTDTQHSEAGSPRNADAPAVRPYRNKPGGHHLARASGVKTRLISVPFGSGMDFRKRGQDLP